MSYENAKLVLSGGVASTPFLHEIFELAGTDTPQIVFDGSPCVSQESLDKKRKMWKHVCEEFQLPEPRWIQDDVSEPLSCGKTNALLDNADVFYVTGGASRKAISQWNKAGLTKDIKDRVLDGHVTALVCIDGIAQVRDITPLSRVGQGFGANVYLYFDSIREPRKLCDGDLIPLNQM
ncbi:hypothetical protein HY312_04660 [Candidatus Saccharibacteria bacterium]|nr:hypothetical protein [Candidatus Saccharibacteria bacterium]